MKIIKSGSKELGEMIADLVQDYSGMEREEIIPGLVQAIVLIADGDDELLIEAGEMLAEGG